MKKFKLVRYKSSTRGYRHIYSPHFDGEEYCELDQFLGTSDVFSNPSYSQVATRLEEMIERRGFKNKYFKFRQSKTNELLCYLLLPEKSDLRLYCCRYSLNVLIVGSGGVKESQARQDTPKLQKAFSRLEDADTKIVERLNSKEVYYNENNILQGNLNFQEE